MSDPPRRPAEPADPATRTLARIHAELAAFCTAGGAIAPQQALERIARIMAAAGYAIPGEEGSRTERFLRLWAGEDRRPG